MISSKSPPKAIQTMKDDDWSLEISAYDVWKHLKKLPHNKASGCDNIPNKIYSLLASFLAGPLATIFRCSISQRTFPEAWKRGIVVPVPKTKPPLLTKLRTLTLLPAPAKILEKLVLTKMFADIDPLLGKSQHAYRKGLSTTTALIRLLDALTVFTMTQNILDSHC